MYFAVKDGATALIFRHEKNVSNFGSYLVRTHNEPGSYDGWDFKSVLTVAENCDSLKVCLFVSVYEKFLIHSIHSELIYANDYR